MILYFASDLIWATRIRSTADSLGIPSRPVRDAGMLAARLGDGDVRALIVDLDTGEAALEMIRRLRAADGARSVRVAAFGPHVETGLMEGARRAGADVVIARGAFDRRLAELLITLDRGDPPKIPDPRG